jgi:hypothetical protein
MTTEKLNEIILILQAVTNNKNRKVAMEAVIELVKHSYFMAVNKQDIYWLINSLEDAKVVL